MPKSIIAAAAAPADGTRRYLFQNTHKLLCNFRAMKWAVTVRTADVLQEGGICAQPADLLSENVQKLVDALSDQAGLAGSPETQKSIRHTKEALQSIQFSLRLIRLIEHALEHIKSYPFTGPLYHELLQNAYFQEPPKAVLEICRDMGIEKNRFYAWRKEALKLVGILLWKVTDPMLEQYAQFLQREGWKVE